MSAWLVLVLGTVVAMTGTVLSVGAAAVSRLELSRWVSERLRGAALATALLSAPRRVLGTAGTISGLGILIMALGLAGLLAPASLPLAAAILLAAIPVLISLGFTLPRAAGRRWAEPVMRAAAPWLERLADSVGPFLPSPPTRRADLEAVLRRRHPDEQFRSEELAVLAGLIAFTEQPVRDVMTPRTEIVAVEEGAPLSEVAMIFMESGYSRIPLYRQTLDQIVGMVHAFDLLGAGEGTPLPVRTVTVAPASRRCADLLFDMQRERRQFAVIIDEYGGTAGIATLEDLLEELIGEIFDEHDAPGHEESLETHLVEVDGATPTEEVVARFGITLPDAAETIGGLLTAALGRIPATGERVVLGDLEFDVLGASPNRVDRVTVRRTGARITVIGGHGDGGRTPP